MRLLRNPLVLLAQILTLAAPFDLRGHQIRRLHGGRTPAEGVVAVWNGDDDGGNKVPQGVDMARFG